MRNPEEVHLITMEHIIGEEEDQSKINEISRKMELNNGTKDLKWFYEFFLSWVF